MLRQRKHVRESCLFPIIILFYKLSMFSFSHPAQTKQELPQIGSLSRCTNVETNVDKTIVKFYFID